MKNLIRLLLIVFSSFFYIPSLIAQSYDAAKENELILFTDANGVTGNIPAHCLAVYLDSAKLGDMDYLKNCFQFLETVPAKAKSVFITAQYDNSVYKLFEDNSVFMNKSDLFSASNGSMVLRLSDEVYADKVIEKFNNSGLFTLVSVCPIGRID